MKVIKFGGSCLKSASDIQKLHRILASDQHSEKVVVLSALYGITDILIDGLNESETPLNEQRIESIVSRIKKRHLEMIRSFFVLEPKQKQVIRLMEPYFKKLKKLYLAILYSGEMTESLRSAIISFGERLAVVLFSRIMNEMGLETTPYFSDEIGIVKQRWNHQNCADLKQTRANLSRLLPEISNGKIPVITGYFAIYYNKRISTFGRNGSDYSASVIAYAFEAEILEFWKDVPGFMSSDPTVVSQSKLIPELSIDEAAELSYFGSGILHPRCLEPIRGTRTQIIIRSFLDPEAESTTIRLNPNPEKPYDRIRGVTFNQHIAVLKINGAGVGYKHGIIGNIGTLLSKKGINIYSIITSQTSINLIIDQKDIERSLRLLRSLKDPDPVIESISCDRDLTLIAIVGRDIKEGKSLVKLINLLNQLEINIEMISAGASDSAYYLLIKKQSFSSSIEHIHDAMVKVH